MITFEEIRKLMDNNQDLINDFIIKENNKTDNNNDMLFEIILSLSNIFQKELLDDYINFHIQYAFIYILRDLKYSLSNDNFIKVIKLLKEFGYNEKSELTTLISIVDMYFTREGRKKGISSLINSLLTTKEASYSFFNNRMNIITKYGSGNFYKANELLNINEIKPKNRYHMCHLLTSEALNIFPNLYGGYYLIPNEFDGFYDHSILIDIDNDLAYDLAFNVALPFSLFNEYYPHPEFTIKGKDFNALDEKMKNTYDIGLTTDLLYNLERIRKQG